MPTDRNHRNDSDDITGRRQIISPRDSQSGLPTRQVWDDTDIVHAVSDNAVSDMTYGDIEFDVVGDAGEGHLIDTSTGEVVWAAEAGGQDIEVEHDETHFGDRSGGPRHVLGAVQKRVPGHGDGPAFHDITDIGEGQPKSLVEADDADGLYASNIGGGLLGAIDDGDGDGAQGISEANALWQLIESEVAPDDSLPELDL